MKIYVFGTRGFPGIQGGVEKHCENLYQNMSDDKMITVFRRKPYLSKTLDKQYKNVTFIDLPSTKIKGIEAFLHSFLCSIRCIFSRPDIVHIHNIGPGIFTPLLRLFKLKTIVTYHSPNYEHKKWNKFGRTILKCGEYFATKTANALIFINPKVLSAFSEKIKEKSTFIPNGVDKLPIAKSSDYLDSLKITKYKYILAVGRITQEKGFDYLIEAFLKAAKTTDYKLVIAGGTDHASEYSKLLFSYVDSGKVVFTGFVEGMKLVELYSFASLFVLPSFNEGFPLVLIEAINYKLPILASDIEANKQLGLPDNHYFPVGDKDSLAQKIEPLFSEKPSRIDYQVEFYSWKEIAQQTEKVYEVILK